MKWIIRKIQFQKIDLTRDFLKKYLNTFHRRDGEIYQVAILQIACLVAEPVKNQTAVQETWVLPLGPEDPLEKGMATHSSIFAWRILEEPGRLQSMGSQRVRQD